MFISNMMINDDTLHYNNYLKMKITIMNYPNNHIDQPEKYPHDHGDTPFDSHGLLNDHLDNLDKHPENLTTLLTKLKYLGQRK